MEEIFKISIIVPVYNVEKYLERCIRSIISQTYSNWEAILIDDGSTDSSGELCDEIAKIDGRIKVFHKQNEGLGITRNYGIRHADGDYIFFLDSDDFIEKNALMTLCKKAIETDSDIVIGNFYYKENKVKLPIEKGLYKDEEIIRNIVLRIIGSNPGTADQLTPSSCGKIYKRNIFIEENIWFPSERELIWEDLAFNYKYMCKCKKIYLDDTHIYHYCFNENSLTHRYDSEKLNKVIKMYRYMKKQIEKTQTDSSFTKRLNNNFIGHIRTCFKLEAYYDKKNGYLQTICKIKKMCQNEYVKKIISESV